MFRQYYNTDVIDLLYPGAMDGSYTWSWGA